MTDPLDYIRENLLHDPDCNDGFPDMTKADGCTCRRAEVIAWAENRKWDAEHDARNRGYRAGRESMRREAARLCRERAAIHSHPGVVTNLEGAADTIEALDQDG